MTYTRAELDMLERMRSQCPIEVAINDHNSPFSKAQHWCEVNAGFCGADWNAMFMTGNRAHYFFSDLTRAVEFKMLFG